MKHHPGASPDRGRHHLSDSTSYVLDSPDRKLARSLRTPLSNAECKHSQEDFEYWLSAL